MSKIRVLLIDDHPAIRAGIRMILEQDPDISVVGEGGDGNEAVRLVELLKPDVLLLDMKMPGKNGVQVAQEVKKKKANVRILGFSAYDDPEYIKGLLACGAAGYLTKEEALDNILQAVHGVARGETGWFSQRAVMQMVIKEDEEEEEEKEKKEKTHLYQLTKREKQMLVAITSGLANKEIALELGISQRTVRYHLSNLYEKLHVNSRSQAIIWALENNLV